MTLSKLACTLALAASALLALPVMAQHDAPAQPEAHAPAAGQDAHAGGHDVPKAGVLPSAAQGIMPMVVSLVVFGLVLAVLSGKVWPVIAKGLQDREEKIRNAIEEAEMARTQAKDALEQYQKSLADARAEAQKMLEQTRAQQQALAAELKAKADKDANELRERARRDIDAAKRAAVSEIYTHAANLGTMIAGKVLKRSVNESDTNGLVEESLRQLESAQS